MGAFPHFINPWAAAAAGAIVIPSLLLLYFLKLRRRELPVPSTILWRKAIQDLQVNAPFQKLRRNLLLLLQLLLLAALLLALARPVMNFTPGAGPRTIILIDHSASMAATDIGGGKTRLDEAKKRAKDLVDTLGRDGAAMVISFDDSAQTLQTFTSDTRALKSAIDGIAQTDLPAKLESAYRLADAQAAFTSGDNPRNRAAPDVYLFSDGRALDADRVTIDGILHYEQIGTPTARNIAIVALNALRSYDHPTQVQVFARLANFGPDPIVGVPIQLTVDGQIRSAGTVNLLPDRYTDDQKRQAIADGFVPKNGVAFAPLELTTSAVINVRQLDDQDDCLAADNSATVIVPPPKILSVLLVSDGNWWLSLGLKVQRLKTFDTMLPAEYRQLPDAPGGGKQLPKPYDVIVFDRDDSLKPRDVPRTGAAIYFGCVPPGLSIKAAVDSKGRRIICTDNTVLDWQRNNPILRHLNLGALYAARSFKLLPNLDSQVLVDGNNCPLVVLHRQDRAIHLIIPFDLFDSNWPRRPTFPIFLYQTMQFMALGSDMELKPSYAPGVTLRVPRFDLAKIDPVPQSIDINGPMGTLKATVPPTGDFVLPALDKVGVYSTNPPVPQYEKIAVNLLDPITSNVLPAPVAPGGQGTAALPAATIKSRRELWRWLVAAAALPLLMIEWWVYTRRVHL